MSRNAPFCLFISCFTFTLTPSINTPGLSIDFMVVKYHPYLHLK